MNKLSEAIVSKKLGHDDQSGFEFSKELLDGESTAAINFDRLQMHPNLGYVMIEYLLCEEEQTVTPYTSHPKKYWNKNASKFLSLWRAKLDFNAKLYLVNYAKKGSLSENEVLLIEVLDMDENGITKEKVEKFTRARFAEWFKKLNKECLSDKSDLVEAIYEKKPINEIGEIKLQGGKYAGETIDYVFNNNSGYLEWMKDKKYPYSAAVKVYLEKLKGN